MVASFCSLCCLAKKSSSSSSLSCDDWGWKTGKRKQMRFEKIKHYGFTENINWRARFSCCGYGPSHDGIKEVCLGYQVRAIAWGGSGLLKWQSLKKTGENSCLMTIWRLYKQTLIMFCYLICCRSYFSHFKLNYITVSVICWGPGPPWALSAILKWDGPRFSAGWFGASPGYRPLYQVMALPIRVSQAGPGWQIKHT